MESEVLKTIVGQGAWAVLFVWLLIDTRKESKAREEKLQTVINKNQEVISELAEKFNELYTRTIINSYCCYLCIGGIP